MGSQKIKGKTCNYSGLFPVVPRCCEMEAHRGEPEEIPSMRALHAGEVTGSDEFAKNQLCVSTSSFIVFSINLVYLKTV